MIKYTIRRFFFYCFCQFVFFKYKILKQKLPDRSQCFKLFFKYIKIFKRSFYYYSGKHKIYYSPVHSGTGWRKYLHGFFEEDESFIYTQYIKTNHTVVDIGANIGHHTIAFSNIAREGLVIAFEPSKYSYEYLSKNVKSIKNVLPINIALSNQNSMVKFYECEDDVFSGLKDTLRNEVIEEHFTLCMKGDDILSNLKLNNIDFIKIDVEGFEQEVLEGIEQTIKTYKPIILCEIYGGTNSNKSPLKTTHFLISLGYTAYVIENKKLKAFIQHNDDHYNYVFLPAT